MAAKAQDALIVEAHQGAVAFGAGQHRRAAQRQQVRAIACVFIVEDEPVIALDLASMVEEAGANVVGPAMTLADAEALSSSEQIQVALLNVRIGNETIISIAAKLASRGVALVFHTGHGDADSLIGRWPQSRVLHKPVRPAEIACDPVLLRPGRA